MYGERKEIGSLDFDQHQIWGLRRAALIGQTGTWRASGPFRKSTYLVPFQRFNPSADDCR